MEDARATGTRVATRQTQARDGPFEEEQPMKRTLTLVGFLIAGTAALSLGCQKKETTTTTTETKRPARPPRRAVRPRPSTQTTTTTSTMDARTPTP